MKMTSIFVAGLIATIIPMVVKVPNWAVVTSISVVNMATNTISVTTLITNVMIITVR